MPWKSPGFFSAVPSQLSREALIERLHAMQDRATGLFHETGVPQLINWPKIRALRDHRSLYNVLAVGYALEILGSAPQHPVRAVAMLDARDLTARLDQLPWTTHAWHGGDWIDCVCTAFYLNARHFQLKAPLEALFGWLLLNVDPLTGLWGRPTPQERRLQPVNGFYRLTRGSYAQFGIDVPRPLDAIDSVLSHSRDTGFFREDCGTACNVLDVIHPLWLCLRQTNHRRDEAERWAAAQVRRIVAGWQPEAGFSFELQTACAPSLQGTEMWLSILWLAADLIGISEHLGYQPRGVHRPEVALPLANGRPTREAADSMGRGQAV
ncbi:MAG TPA: hypothetical protein VH678_10405 [Xanthobacteraceae bacterium]|jgi:hypothetical protein